MKKHIFGLLFMACALTSKAQIRGAIVVGPHGASVTPAFTQFTDTVTRTATQKAGIHIGLLANVPLAKNLYLQTGLMYAAKGGKEQQTFDPSFSELQTAITTLSVNYIDAPFSLMYKAPLKGKTSFILGAGPQASLFYSGEVTYSTLDVFGKYDEIKEDDLPVGKREGQYRILHFAANAFAGFEFGRIFLTANYSKSLTPFYKTETQEFKHKTLGATLGVFLGKQLQPEPVIKDKDGDGVTDDMDECLTVAGSMLTKGCPDGDGDGIADKEDACPSVAGIIAYKGCPVPDKDGDGINDAEDKCPDIVGLNKYNGCPAPDEDKDGVIDDEDNCPTIHGLIKYKGCPVPDTDKDGVNDEEDNCPAEAGTAANKGCPQVTKEVEEKVAYAARQIQFEYLKAQLTDSSYGILNEVAEVLKAHPQVNILIEGHTSGTGKNDGANILLSQQRAQNVKAYLVSRGIESERITAVGYGSSKPITKSSNPAEKAKNRRVELKLIPQ
jgi:OmpA-OmpF porin, OOP family